MPQFDLNNLNFLEWDYPAIYEGVMSPENNVIMIVQNLWMTITSSIGYLALTPFYQVKHDWHLVLLQIEFAVSETNTQK